MFKPLFSNPTHFTLGLVRLTCSLFQFRTPNELRVSGLTPNQEPKANTAKRRHHAWGLQRSLRGRFFDAHSQSP
ncbi:hypothetical protein F9C07_12997 [Aspergillus flavus]|uniref:Uncharacterized protein n=1 Tax=Aspergillus flavus (strain ATCC 200026 / FGSC A1120 / IAM 13836 / NRRL 3357 / JCM 12722 / SRRC 167) TaxID=332952 RepID=A0A7U2R2D7_ASPFN|nr:hypothetical protein F9C07_12997 [Aspergillus flavus]